MRKIIASTRVTLDGFIAGLHGEMDWMEEFFSFKISYTGEAFACKRKNVFIRSRGTQV